MHVRVVCCPLEFPAQVRRFDALFQRGSVGSAARIDGNPHRPGLREGSEPVTRPSALRHRYRRAVEMNDKSGAVHLITNAAEARACFKALVEAFDEIALVKAPHTVRFHSGSITAETYFFQRQNIWAMPTDGSQLTNSKNRYWNSFGVGGAPRSASTSIAVEINHPHEGRSTVSGRFLVSRDRFFIGHTGRIGGGLKGSDISAIERITGKSRGIVEIDGSLHSLAFLTEIEPTEVFITRLGQFVCGMHIARERLKAAKEQTLEPEI